MHKYLPRSCAFEDCANLFLPRHGAVKYCSKRCCQAQAHRNWKRKNADAIRERQKLAARRYRAKWSEEKRDKKRKQIRENNKKWYYALTEEQRVERSRRQYENCDKDRKRNLARKNRRKKYANSNQHKIRCILRQRLRAALLAQGATKHAPTLELLGCTVEQLRAHIEAQFEPWMTWSNWAHDTWHVDHIKPCASFDLTDIEQQRECFHFSNLQPLQATKNMRKSARLNHPADSTLQRLTPRAAGRDAVRHGCVVIGQS